MRRDLDVIRERRILREVREDLIRDAGGWGWRDQRPRPMRRPKRLATEDELNGFVRTRPGTPEGGF